ncbi:uncharacterized protein LOC108030501 [Drosophila biarmipes]|uniref:uncharacterized protein LOC108030501 n=1 Tax=Drosophila biarmipes TaxID=125945 RepID=UPI0021CC8626|nr:uncharacterized protein LOC108030501 [Drosophila biarmipes]
MSKSVLTLALCCFLMVEIQADTDRKRLHETCMRVFGKCIKNEDKLGRQDDTSQLFNEFCRRSDSGWSDLSRCDLLRVACLSTVRDCESPTCKNVAHRMNLCPTDNIPSVSSAHID